MFSCRPSVSADIWLSASRLKAVWSPKDLNARLEQRALDGFSMRGHLPGKNVMRSRDAFGVIKSFKVSRRGEQRRAARAKNRRRKAAEARGSSAGLSGGQRAKDSRGQCANHKRAKRTQLPSARREASITKLGAVSSGFPSGRGVAAVNRLFTQVRHTSSWPGKSYLKNNSRSFEIVVSLLESPVPVSGFCEDVTHLDRGPAH